MLLLTSFLVVVVASFLLFRWISAEMEPGGQRMRAIVHGTSAELVKAYSRGEFARARHRLGRHRIQAWIEDELGQSLVSPGTPPEIRRQITGFPQSIYPYQNPAGRFFVFARPVEHDGKRYHVILAGDRRAFRKQGHRGIFLLPVFAMLAGLVASSAALSYWILRPLKTLRDTAGAISGDDMSARIPRKVTERGDAFGVLGREFNQMTERLELSMRNQKQLLRDVSHELRSPLARIQVAASLWARRCDDPVSHERIDNEVGRLDALIGKLLSLSRLQAGMDLQIEVLDLVDLIQQVVDDASFEYERSDRSVSLIAPDSLPMAADPTLVTSAVENVVRNAMRHSPDGGHVRVSLDRVGDMAAIRVADQGPGISEVLLDRIFEPFFRADDARDTGTGEHGVGLALTRAIAESHGGSVSASNLSPSGLEIVIELPIENTG